MRLLIVEDDLPTLSMLHILCKDYWQITDCDYTKTVEETIDYLKKTRPDLILLDFMLNGSLSVPIMDLLKSKYPLNPPRVVAMSARSDIKELAAKCGVEEILKKPFNLENLEELVFKK